MRLSGAARRSLPTVLIVGAQKGGTSSLHHNLVQHPEVGGASHKEIHYFDLNADRSPLWYRSHLPVQGRFRHVLDSTPYYLFHPAVPERAHALVPDAKVIMLLRDPVRRAYSHYQHSRAKGWETLEFVAALDAEEERLAGAEERLMRSRYAYSAEHRRHSYAARSRYSPQVRRWMRSYRPEQMLILRSEDMFADATAVLSSVQDWLGLSRHIPQSVDKKQNARSYPPLDPALAQTIRPRFDEDVRELEELTGIRFGWR